MAAARSPLDPPVYLVDGVRTPIGRYGGALAGVRPDDLAALVVRELTHRAGLAGAPEPGAPEAGAAETSAAGADLGTPSPVDEVILGAANQAGEDNRNVARMAVLLSGLPQTTPGYTVNRLCASGLTAVAAATHQIRAGEADVVIAGGVESMTRAPWVMAKPGTPWARPGEVSDTALGWRFTNPRLRNAGAETGAKITLSMGETAEEVATLDGISRAESDAYALRSQQRAIAAIDDGRFAEEIVAVPVPGGDPVTEDECPRRNTSADKLASLAPTFRADGIVTAGSSSPLSDGAAALIVASEHAVERHGWTPLARVVRSADAGVPPHLMGLGPVPATERALQRSGWRLDDVDTVEVNEAFGAQTLAVLRRLKLDGERVNAAGGAIALGHPLGCSGARLLVTLLGRMRHEGGRKGLATLCVGVGQGVTMLVERV